MKTKFQSTDDFVMDYEKYKEGNSWKIIYFYKSIKQTEYVRDILFKIRLHSLSYFYSQQGIHVVDLRHKFEKVCKLPELDIQ